MRRGGLCVDVACGLGEESLWAAREGFDVVALDISDVAISGLNTAALEFGVRDKIDTRVWNISDGLPAHLAGRCSLVICTRFRDPDVYQQLAYMAAPTGLIAITVLSEVGATVDPGPYHATPGELVCAFRDLDVEILRTREADGEATLVARRY